VKTVKIISGNTIKGGGWNPSGRKQRNMKTMTISTANTVKGGGSGPIYKP